jgi:hypothetical protein
LGSVEPERPSQQVAEDDRLTVVVALCPDPGNTRDEYGDERGNNRRCEQDGVNRIGSAG